MSALTPLRLPLEASAAPPTAFSFVNGTLTVNAATLTVTATAASKTYGSANPSFSDSITGYVNSDPSTVVSGTASLDS